MQCSNMKKSSYSYRWSGVQRSDSLMFSYPDSHLTFSDRLAHTPPNNQVSHIQPLKEAYGCTLVQTHTHSKHTHHERIWLITHIASEYRHSSCQQHPLLQCVCVCVRGKQWIDREGVTHYSMGASILWHSTINKTPLVFDPLMWAGYPLPTDREAEGVKEQVQTIAISQEWCENVSLTTWTWISPRAGVQFCDHGNYYKLLHQSLQHPTERRRTPMSVTHSHVKWHRHAPERYADTDNMT